MFSDTHRKLGKELGGSMDRMDDRPEERERRDPLENHPLRDTLEMEADVRRKERPDATRDAPKDSAAPAAVGGVGGAIAGAGVGTVVGGPIGTVIGALAGAVGGWWAGKAAADANTVFTLEDDTFYRQQYETAAGKLGDPSYDEIRHAYQLGHIARSNPSYSNKAFEEIESELERGWTADLKSKYGEWSTVRPYVREGYLRRRENLHDSAFRDSARDRTPSVNPERASGRSASALDGLRRDDTVGY
jgi:hypothetical protein